MKFTVIFLLAAYLQSGAKVYSQKVTLSDKNASLQKLFKEINRQTGYQFFYKDKLLNKAGKVTVDIKDVNIEDALRVCFKNFPLAYDINSIDKTIILRERPPAPAVVRAEDDAAGSRPLPPAEISGRVTDPSGNGLIGASVSVKGTNIGTATDASGRFKFQSPVDKGVLVISYIGFTAQEVGFTKAGDITIVLQPAEQKVDEVVITAYGRVKRASLTDAVATISGEKLENRPLRTLTDGLIGLSPGLNIRVPNGAPETTPSLNIRGFTGINSSAAPLVLIDGVERPIQDINPNDVESISLLKDGASTAVYGSRAPYGILLVTTKSGKSGKAAVNYSGNVRIGKITLFPTQPDSPEWARYINMAQRNGRPDGTGTDGIDAITIARMEAWLKKDWNNPAFDALRTQFGDKAQMYIENGQFPTTDFGFKYWTREQSFATTKLYDAYLNRSAISQQHNINISGGSDRIQYFTSLGYNGGAGLFKGDFNYNRRYNLQTKLNYKATDWLDLRTDVNYVHQENQGANYRGGAASDAGTGTVANYGDIFGSMVQYFATPLRVPSGGAYSWILGASGILGEGGLLTNRRNDIVLTGGATLRPFKYFELNGDYTMRIANSRFRRTDKVAYTEWPDGTKVQNNRSVNNSSITRTSGEQNYRFAKFSAQYKRTFAQDHNVLAQVGMQVEETKFESLTGSKTDLFAPNQVDALNAAANNPLADDNLYEWATLGYYGVVTYDFRQKYMLKLAARTDASSRFAPETRWGTFPSVSGAWNAARETFWPLKQWISEFKPRASWSTSGDLTSVGAGNYYAYLPVLNFGVSKNTLLAGNFSNTATPPGLVNTNPTWAKPTVLDFGVDVSALRQRLTVTYDWYQRTIKGEYGPPDPVSLVLGTTAPRVNNSASEVRGWELSVGWNDRFNVASKPFTYNVRFNISDYIGYVTEYSANTIGVRSGVWTPGEKFGQNFVYKAVGIAQNTNDLNGRTLNGTFNYPGYIMYQDLDGDGYINSGTGGYWYSMGDQVADGFNYPRKSFSILPSFSWNNITLSAVLEGVMDWKVYSSSVYVWGTNVGTSLAYFFTPVFKESSGLGYWTPKNTGAFFPALNTGSSLATDKYALNLAHLRIRNITLGYDLPQQWISKAKLRRANVYFSGENMGFIYNKAYIKYDPEFLANQSGFGANSTNGYPPLRYYSFGVNIGL